MVLARFGKIDESKDFSNDNALVAISVGQDYHSPEKFTALTRLITRSPFKKTHLMIADTLQAHNILMCNKANDLAEARELSKRSGDDFLATAKISLGYYDNVIRWNTFINDSRYVEQKNLIDELYNNDMDFTKAVDSVSGLFLAKQANKLAGDSNFNLINALNHCKNYIKEELAVMMLWRNHSDFFSFNLLIYPKPMHQATKYIYNKYIYNIKPNFLKELTYIFDKRDENFPTNTRTIISNQPTEEDMLLLDTIEDTMHLLQTKLISLKRKLRQARDNNTSKHKTRLIQDEFTRILELIKQSVEA